MAAVAALVAAALVVVMLRGADERTASTATAATAATAATRRTPPVASAQPATPAPYALSPGVRLKARPTPTAPTCTTSGRGSFDPTRVSVLGATGPLPVVALHRDGAGVPGVPPLTSTGKAEFAFDLDQGVRPGDPRGNVLLNAHTWPDGSALGNRLLRSLGTGGRLLVEGGDGQRLCYQVTRRVEVLASEGLAGFYATDGPAQVAIVVCSGRRLGPGHWEKRTIWFAAPHT